MLAQQDHGAAAEDHSLPGVGLPQQDLFGGEPEVLGGQRLRGQGRRRAGISSDETAERPPNPARADLVVVSSGIVERHRKLLGHSHRDRAIDEWHL